MNPYKLVVLKIASKHEINWIQGPVSLILHWKGSLLVKESIFVIFKATLNFSFKSSYKRSSLKLKKQQMSFFEGHFFKFNVNEMY